MVEANFGCMYCNNWCSARSHQIQELPKATSRYVHVNTAVTHSKTFTLDGDDGVRAASVGHAVPGLKFIATPFMQ